MAPQPPATTVSGAPPAPPAAPPAAAPPAAAPPAVDPKALETVTEQLAEMKRTAEYWHGEATKAKPADKTPAPAAEPEDETDLLDLATKGPKAFNTYLEKWAKKNGFARVEDIDSKVNSKAAQISKETELLGKYPDLKKQDSEFFKTTASHYGAYKKAGIPEHMAMELAAQKTELEMMRSGKMKTPQQQSDETKAEKEKERKARIAAQAGERGPRAPVESEEDDELDDQQKKIAAAMGITEEAYKARAKKGVALRNR